MYDGSPSGKDHQPAPTAPALRLAPIVVYTAITQDYDTLKEQPRMAGAEASFVAFLDAPRESRTWQSVPAHRGFDDPNRNAKIHKILSHVHFPAAEYSLWIDGSVTILRPDAAAHLIDVHLADCDLAVFPHRTRTCVYQEASECLQRRLDEPEVIWQQVCRYTREGHPAGAGLAECPVILRRHSAAVRAFNEAWWEEITRASRRDQLSFDYVARRTGLRYALLPGTIADNPWFHRGPHAVAALEPAALEPAAPSGTAAAGVSADAPVRAPRFYRSWSGARRRRTSVAFGPVREKPSWGWVGFDVARELSKEFDVALYGGVVVPPPCDVLFVVKKRPGDGFVAQALERRAKLVYCPIDHYDDADEIAADAEMLGACAAVLAHCERLIPLLGRYCDDVRFVEHHARYALPDMVPYKEAGYVLWIGTCQYLPFLLDWLERHPIEAEIKILSDFANDNARALAYENAAAIGRKLEIARDTPSVDGHRVYAWSERRQQAMMRECRAALDVKLTRFFGQRHKPPTKAQQYVASGIPFAVNPDSYSAEYFRARGFEVVSPLDPERWLSREYWEATRAAAPALRAATSMDAVAAKYRELIESLAG